MNEWVKNYEHCLFTEQNVQEILYFYYTLSGLLYFVRISFHGKKMELYSVYVREHYFLFDKDTGCI